MTIWKTKSCLPSYQTGLPLKGTEKPQEERKEQKRYPAFKTFTAFINAEADLASNPISSCNAVACVAGVKRGRGRGNLGARGRKERNACKDAIVFSIFHAQILSVKIVIGQN